VARNSSRSASVIAILRLRFWGFSSSAITGG
jgi:hypothetical protein